jgi:hypothetical protein
MLASHYFILVLQNSDGTLLGLSDRLMSSAEYSLSVFFLLCCGTVQRSLVDVLSPNMLQVMRE